MSEKLSTSLVAGFNSPTPRLTLRYLPEDNKLPSEIKAEAERKKAVEQGCSYTAPILSEEEQRAADELECYQDQLAWPVRKLRLYPAHSPLVRASYGTIRPLHVASEAVEELIQVNGSATADLEFEGDGLQLTAYALFDESGVQVYPTITYRGGGQITLSQKVWGLIKANYTTQYRVIELTCPPIGEDFEVMAIAYAAGEVATAMVSYELKDCESGGVIGTNCGGGSGTGTTPDPVQPPIPGRYRMISMDHPSEGKVDEPLYASIVLQNINGIAGSGAVTFGLRYASVSSSASFSCEAYGYTTVKIGIVPREEGNFTTVAGVVGDFFSQKTGSVTITDGEELAEEWYETERAMSDIDVGGVGIKRIETVTMQRMDGSKVKLIFDNSEVQ
jgi:hypothetical protein